MMQCCASAASSEAADPFLITALQPWQTRDPATSNRHRRPIARVADRPETVRDDRLLCFAAVSTPVQCAGRRVTPSGTTPSRTKRHRAMSSLRAKATIIFLRRRGALAVRA